MSRHNGLPGYDAWKTRSDLDEEARHYAGYDDDDDDDSYPPPCTNKRGHSWVCSDENEEICYCEWCGADGNA